MPDLIHVSIAGFRQLVADSGDGFVEHLKELLAGGWLRKIEGGLGRGIGIHETDDSAGNEREMIGELAGGHGFLVRLPGELVFREALEEPARDGCLDFEFSEQ